MAKLLTTIAVGILAFFNTNCQVQYGGTYSIAAICKDGVVLSADSRGAILRGDTSIAYFDSIQKVFVVGDCAISVVGLIALGDRFVSDYITEFSKKFNQPASPDSCIMSFLSFLSGFPAIREDVMKLNLLATGFKDGHPAVCYIIPKESAGKCAIDSGIALQDRRINFGKGTKFDENYCRQHSCAQVAPIVEKSILNYSIKYGKQFAIGGKITVVAIKHNKQIIWMRNKPMRQKWKNINEFKKDFRKGAVKMTYVSNEAKRYVGAILER